MNRNHISFIIVPHSRGKQRNITLTRKRFHQIVGVGAVCALALLIFIVHYLMINGSHRAYKRLKDESAQQTETISQYEETIKKLQASIENFESYAHKLNIMAGLKSTEVLREVGVGDSSEGRQFAPELQEAVPSVDLQNLGQKADQLEKNLDHLMHFFENQSLRLACTPSIMPTKGYLSSGYKMRNDPFTGKRQMHWGIDIATPHGNPVVATADGVVIAVKTEKIGGRTVKISHPNTGFTTVYCHLSKFNVKSGQKIKRGDVIGYVGSTGKAKGPHVHYEILLNGKNVNPYNYLLEE